MTRYDLELAMEAMWEVLEQIATPEQLQKLKEDHDAIHQVAEHGANGPAGLGLGRFGGHAIG